MKPACHQPTGPDWWDSLTIGEQIDTCWTCRALEECANLADRFTPSGIVQAGRRWPLRALGRGVTA